MIADNMAQALVSTATKCFEREYDPDKYTIQKIFFDYFDDFLKDPQVIKNTVRPVVLEEVRKMLTCGTIDAGFEIYECPNCHKSHIICYTCKSRFCNSCGIKAAKIRANTIAKNTLNVSHRHVVFTIDESLRTYFKKYRDMLSLLFDSARDTLMYVFDKMNAKSKTFIPGIIISLHTFGRSLCWNPHVHCLLTEGGMDQDGNYKRITYINYESLRKSFMKVLLDKMKDYFIKYAPEESKKFKYLVNNLYKKDNNGFYVHAPKMKNKNGKDATINYIIRYCGRPAMAQSRITAYDKIKGTVDYYYEDHATEEYVEVHEDVITFIKKLVQHIPEEQFKMVRYYGLYATCERARHKLKIKELIKKLANKAILSKVIKEKHYRMSLIETFNVDPLLCSCGHYMEYIDYWVPYSRRN